MNFERLQKSTFWRAGTMLAAVLFATALAIAKPHDHSVFVLTSTNDPSANSVVIFRLDTAGTPSLPLVNSLLTGGKGGASTNAGILQFHDDFGAVANFGSNTVSQLVRYDSYLAIGRTSLCLGLRQARFRRPRPAASLRRRHQLCRES